MSTNDEREKCPHCGSPRTEIKDVDAHLASLPAPDPAQEAVVTMLMPVLRAIAATGTLERLDLATIRSALKSPTPDAQLPVAGDPLGVPEIDLETLRKREVQMMGAAISTRSWYDMENAYNQLRDKIDAELGRRFRIARASPPTVVEGESGEVDVSFEVWEDDMMIASSTDENDARHYHAVYSQDGPVRLVKAVTTRTAINPQPRDTGKGKGDGTA